MDETKESIVPFKFLKEELLIRHLTVSPGAGIQIRRDSMEAYLWNDILQLDSDKEKSKIKTKKLEKIIIGKDEQYHNPDKDLNYGCLEDCFDIFQAENRARKALYEKEAEYVKEIFLPYLNCLKRNKKEIFKEAVKTYFELALRETPENRQKLWDARINLAAPMWLYYYGDEQKSEV